MMSTQNITPAELGRDHAGKWLSNADIDALLRSNGLLSGQANRRLFKEAQSEVASARHAADLAARIAPFMADAREMAAEDATVAEIESIAVDLEMEARKEQERAEEQAREEEEAAARYAALRAAKDSAVSAIEQAVPAISFTGAAGGSFYARFRGLKLRVSDHAQKSGGGFNLETGERMGEADISWVIDSDGDVTVETDHRDVDRLDRATIRSVIAAAIRRSR